MARAALELGVRDVAEMAKVAPSTITRLEAGEELKPRTVEAVQGALESAGVEFIDENGGGAGVRLKKRPGYHPVDDGAPRPKPVSTRPKPRSRRRGPV